MAYGEPVRRAAPRTYRARPRIRPTVLALLLVPPLSIAGGLAAACLLGAVAGLYPAMRASRLTPTEAPATT